MNPADEEELVIPVIEEQLRVDAVPVATGGVRIVKRVKGHEELIERELRSDRVEVRRVKVDREVDGPQQIVQAGDTLIVPIVEETLRIERRWVVTEEIHITRTEEKTPFRETMVLNREEVSFERFDRPDTAE